MSRATLVKQGEAVEGNARALAALEDTHGSKG
jgi:hypothetical protein